MKGFLALVIVGLLCCFVGCKNNENMSLNISDESGVKSETVGKSDLPWYEKIDMANKVIDPFKTIVVEMDNCIYYISKTGVNKYTKSDNTDKQVVLGEDVEGLYKYGNMIYYHTHESIKCIDSKDNVSHVWDWSMASAEERDSYIEEICGFWFYRGDVFVMDSGISAIRVNSRTGKIDDFLRDFTSVAFVGDNCYYIEHAARTFSIYSMNINTKEVNLIRGNGNYDPENKDPDKLYYGSVLSVGDSLFYTIRGTEEGTYLFDSNGNDSFLIPADDYSLQPFYTNSSLYYSKINRDGVYELYMYSIGEQTSRLIVTNKGHFRDLVITESKVLFRPHENAAIICVEY